MYDNLAPTCNMKVKKNTNSIKNLKSRIKFVIKYLKKSRGAQIRKRTRKEIIVHQTTSDTLFTKQESKDILVFHPVHHFINKSND